MLFSGIPFLYYFLPAVVLVYFLLPRGLKNGWLLLSSLFFYGWGEPKYLALMAVSITAFYLYGLAIEGAKTERAKKVWLFFSAATGILLLALFKYADFFLSTAASLTGLSIPLLRLALPIGISFYTFQCMSYTIDVYRGEVAAQRSIVSFGAYVSLFPQLIAGPIVRYRDVAEDLAHRTHSWEKVYDGALRFLIGLGKKVLLANNLGQLTELFRESGEKSVLFYWLYAIGFLLHIYFDFSGYSDMAIGLGKVFGFRFCENFDYPYVSQSVTEFWRRWHMSLGSWLRDYVYIPLGGNRVRKPRWVANILITWLLTGLWHGAAWNFVVWGLFFGILLLLEKGLDVAKLPGLLRRGYVLLAVCISFVIFNAPSMAVAISDLGGLWGIGGVPLASPEALYYLRSYAPLLLAGGIGATPLAKKLALRLPEAVRAVLQPLFMAALLLLCTAYLVDGSFNPFLYFRF